MADYQENDEEFFEQTVGSLEPATTPALPVPTTVGAQSGALLRPAPLTLTEENPIPDWRAAAVNGETIVAMDIREGYYVTDLSIHRIMGRYTIIAGIREGSDPALIPAMIVYRPMIR